MFSAEPKSDIQTKNNDQDDNWYAIANTNGELDRESFQIFFKKFTSWLLRYSDIINTTSNSILALSAVSFKCDGENKRDFEREILVNHIKLKIEEILSPEFANAIFHILADGSGTISKDKVTAFLCLIPFDCNNQSGLDLRCVANAFFRVLDVKSNDTIEFHDLECFLFDHIRMIFAVLVITTDAFLPFFIDIFTVKQTTKNLFSHASAQASKDVPISHLFWRGPCEDSCLTFLDAFICEFLRIIGVDDKSVWSIISSGVDAMSTAVPKDKAIDLLTAHILTETAREDGLLRLIRRVLLWCWPPLPKDIQMLLETEFGKGMEAVLLGSATSCLKRGARHCVKTFFDCIDCIDCNNEDLISEAGVSALFRLFRPPSADSQEGGDCLLAEEDGITLIDRIGLLCQNVLRLLMSGGRRALLAAVPVVVDTLVRAKQLLLDEDGDEAAFTRDDMCRAIDCYEGYHRLVEQKIECFHSRYTVGDRLGAGSFAVVSKVTDIVTGALYAVKMTQRAGLSAVDEEAVRSERILLTKMRHKHVISFIDFFEETDRFYMVLEYLPGGELFDRITKREAYSESDARQAGKIFLSAVSYIHSKDVVHRDLKPENLLMTSDSDEADLKIADFGFAKEATGLTLRTQGGSPGYISPEVIDGRPYGKPTDMWAAGIILFHMLGGYLPFDAKSQLKLFAKITRGVFQFDPAYWGNVSNEAKDLISRLLTIDQNQRLTAEQALQHPWFDATRESLDQRDLGKNLETMKTFIKNARFRAAVKAVLTANKFRRF